MNFQNIASIQQKNNMFIWIKVSKKNVFILLFVFLFGGCMIRPGLPFDRLEISREQMEISSKITPIYINGRYQNPFPPDEKSDTTPFKVHFSKNKAITRPAEHLPAYQVDLFNLFNEDHHSFYISWLGHSTIIMQFEGKKILIDPVLVNNISPFPLIKIKRYQATAPLKTDDLPIIDAVFISHNHYDHLDKQTIKKLKDKTHIFIVPEGVGKYLKKWGIEKSKIKEVSWWDEGEIYSDQKKMTFVCTPARHFSGRGIYSINNSLWASFVFIGENNRVFYSGDSSYNYHFKQIGHHYGPFNLSIMECGQYNEAWSESHLFPEETVRAHIDLKSDFLLPVHWGSFTLSKHDWWEPIERVSKVAIKKNVNIITPKVGEVIYLKKNTYTTEWWKDFIND